MGLLLIYDLSLALYRLCIFSFFPKVKLESLYYRHLIYRNIFITLVLDVKFPDFEFLTHGTT